MAPLLQIWERHLARSFLSMRSLKGFKLIDGTFDVREAIVFVVSELAVLKEETGEEEKGRGFFC